MQERHVVDLLDAYALGALEPAEVDAIERHLEGCPECRAAAEIARSTATQLLLGAPLTPPPAGLRAKVVAAIQREASQGTPAHEAVNGYAPAGATAADLSAPAGGNPVARLLRSVFGGSVAGEPEVDRLLRELMADPACAVWPVAGTESAPGASGRLVAVPSRRDAVLLTHGLTPTPRGQEYQVWFLRGGAPLPNALFQVGRGGRAARIVRAPDAIGSFEVVAVTPEPMGGSPGPTGPIVLAGKLEMAS